MTYKEHTCTRMALLYNVTRRITHSKERPSSYSTAARSLINAHLSGREKPSPQSVPWPSLFLLQLDFYHNTLQGTSQLCLHSQRARSLINADPSGREKPRLHIQFYARVVVEFELRYVQRLPAVANYNCTVVAL